jgi:predicted MFS family arabinose efflux permease
VELWGGVRLLAGMASAGTFVMASASVVTVLAGHGRGHLSGLHYGGVGLGIAGSGVLVLAVSPVQGWPAAWLWLAGIGAVLALAAWRLIPPAAPAQAHTVGGKGPVRLPMALLAASYFCEGMGYIVTGTFLVAIIKQTPGLAAWAEWSWVAVGLAAFPSVFLWSALAKRIGAVWALFWAHIAQAIGVVLPTLSEHPVAVLVSAVLFGGTFLAITGLVLSIGGTMAAGRTGRMIAWLTAAFGLGQVIGPPIAGVIADVAGGFALPLRLAGAVVVLGGGLAALVPWARRNPQS